MMVLRARVWRENGSKYVTLRRGLRRAAAMAWAFSSMPRPDLEIGGVPVARHTCNRDFPVGLSDAKARAMGMGLPIIQDVMQCT